MLPRALAVNFRFNAKAFSDAIDKALLNITISGQIEAQLRNYASITDPSGTVYLLYDFLDRGTRPHWIGDEGDLLGNVRKNFGPVWGPVFHPGTRPYDISARTAAFVEGYMQQAVESGAQGFVRRDDAIQWREFRALILNGLNAAMDFARNITPDAWQSVRDSYALYVNGRRYES